MKLICLLIFLFLSIQASYSQDAVLKKDDSLQQLLQRNIHDSSRVKILEELHNVWKNKNYARSIEYIREAIALADKTPATNYNPTGLRYELGFALMEMGDAVRSIEIFQQIMKELDGKDPEAYLTAQAFIGMNYETLGNYPKALEYQLAASKDYERLLLHDSARDRRGVLGNPHKTAVYYLQNNQVDSALYYGQQGLSRLKDEPLNDYNRFFSWFIKTAMGDIYAKLNKYDLALSYYKQAEEEAVQYHSTPDLIPVYLGRAKVYYQKNELSHAKQYTLQAYHLADTLKLYPLAKESALFLKTIFSAQHQMDSALYYYQVAMVAKDSILNTDIARKIDALEFAEEKRRQENKVFLREKSFQKKQLYSFTGILLSILVAAFLYYKNRLKQKANLLLAYENREIFLQRNQLQQELESFEMQALKAQLNPHFIFNCLNCIDAFIYSNDKYRATMYLNKFARLLRNILDSSKNNTVSLQKDIQSLRLYTDLEELRNDHKFETLYLLDESLEIGKYMVPPLILQPLVENAILHGLKNRNDRNGRLTISISLEGERIKCVISDNGIGRKQAMLIPRYNSHSYGMELTQSRIKMFNREENASLIIEDLYNDQQPEGTCAIVFLKKQFI